VRGAVSRGATCANAASLALSGGTASAADWCYNEVGNVLLTATVTNYLGSGQDVTGTSGLDGDANGPYVGRFSPKKFVLITSPVAPSLTPRTDLACAGSAFTYMDETLRLAFKVEARNTQDAVTANYSTTSGYAKVNNVAAWGFGARSGTTNLTTRIDTGGTLAGSWVNGVADMTFNTAIRRVDPTPDGPYPALHFGIAPADTEPTMTFDLDVDSAGGNDHKDLGVLGDVRFGRMRLDNVLGSEARQLPVPMRVEYWNNGGFTTNADDSCTSVPKSAIALDFTPASNLTACETMVNSASLAFSAGVAPLVLAAPGPNNSGSVVLKVNLTGASGNYCNAVGVAAVPTVPSATPLPYLAGRWNDAADGDGIPATLYDDNPSARAAFGIYGSQPGNFIYFRERFD
jgi:MSHA biogenesis protein MshQ